MKKFEYLLGLSQEDLKSYLSNYLRGTGYKVKSGDGFLFAKGTIPVLLVSHMDTFRKQIPKTIIKEPTLDGTRIIAENSIVGGDDRCGCWMIMNIIKKAKCSVLFLEDEEIGCVGARKFASTDHINYVKENISFMIEFDRRGSNDCVFYSNDNREFIKYIEEKTSTKEAIGSSSDINTLMPTSNVAGVNLSCGYYKEHTKDEYIMEDEMNSMIERVINFLTTESEFPKYEYVAKKYTFSNNYNYGSWWGKGSSYYNYGGYGYGKSINGYDLDEDYDFWSKTSKTKTRSRIAKEALASLEEISICITLKKEFGGEEMVAYGKTPDECWARLFIENEHISFNMIEDFYFSN